MTPTWRQMSVLRLQQAVVHVGDGGGLGTGMGRVSQGLHRFSSLYYTDMKLFNFDSSGSAGVMSVCNQARHSFKSGAH